MDGICQGLRHGNSLNKVLLRLPISICAEAAKPSLGAFPYFIRLDTNVHHFTAWLISSLPHSGSGKLGGGLLTEHILQKHYI